MRIAGQFWAHVVTHPVHDDAGELMGFVEIACDMTGARTKQLDQERTRLALFQSQKMASIGRLTGGIAHDFNNLLMVVLGSLEIIRARLSLDPNIMSLLENAVSATQRGKSVIQHLLAFAQRQDLQPETIDLSTILRDMMDDLQLSLEPSIVLEDRLSANLGAVHVDPRYLKSVVRDLVMNACDAMPKGGCIVISGREAMIAFDQQGSLDAGRHVCLSVTDQGDGVHEMILARATEPFFTTKGLAMNAGLGLSTAHGFAEQSGGRLVLKSDQGQGTVAELWFPVVAVAIKACGEVTEVVAADTHYSSMGVQRPRVVLVIGDDRLELMHTMARLNGLGHKVFTARSRKQASNLIRRESMIDLVMIDETIPEIARLKIVEMIRLEQPHLPVVFTKTLSDATSRRSPRPMRRDDVANAIARAKAVVRSGSMR